MIRYHLSRFFPTVLLSALALPSVLLVFLLVIGSFFEPALPSRFVATGHHAATPDHSPAALATSQIYALFDHAAASLPGGTTLTLSATPPTPTGSSDPLLGSCNPSLAPSLQPFLASTEGFTVQASSTSYSGRLLLEVVGPGLGARVLGLRKASLHNCASTYLYSSNPALTTPDAQVTGFVEQTSVPATATSPATLLTAEVLRFGDVLAEVAVATPSNQYSLLSALGTNLASALSTALTSSCAAPLSTEQDATRNPTQSDYQPFGATTTLTPPANVPRPDLTLLNAQLPVVPTPATGQVTTPPTPPVVPSIALSTTVSLPASDLIGPGCGWAFVGVTPPAYQSSSRAALVQSALTALVASWQSWPNTVSTYLYDKATYQADLASYQAYLATLVSTTTTTLPTTPLPSTTIPPAPSTTTSLP